MILLRKFIDYKSVSFDEPRPGSKRKILHYKNIIISNCTNYCCINIKTKVGRSHVKNRRLLLSKHPSQVVELHEQFYKDDKKYNLFSFAYEPDLKRILGHFINYYAEPGKISSYAICFEKSDKHYDFTEQKEGEEDATFLEDGQLDAFNEILNKIQFKE